MRGENASLRVPWVGKRRGMLPVRTHKVIIDLWKGSPTAHIEFAGKAVVTQQTLPVNHHLPFTGGMTKFLVVSVCTISFLMSKMIK